MSRFPATTSPGLPPPPPKRPVSVIVLGIIAIVYGVTMVGCMVIGIAATALSSDDGLMDQVMQERADTRAYFYLSGLIETIAYLVLTVAGIGLVMGREWARRLALGYAIYALAATTVMIILSALLIIGPMWARRQPGNDMHQFEIYVGIGSGACFSLASITLALSLLWFLTRPHVKPAMRGVKGEGSRVKG